MENDSNHIHLPCAAKRLLPHRPPMLLIDELIEREGDRAKATATLAEDSICQSGDRGVLQEYFLEIIAQTMAAANGYDALADNSPPKDGFIVGVDAFETSASLGRQKEFTIAVVKNMEFGSMKVMEGSVHAGDMLIARAELKVWEQDSDED